MRYPSNQKQATRGQILDAAARQFRERGFGQASVGSVMKEAGLTHGGFYAHFASKDELVAEVIRGGFGGVSEKFESRFEGLEGEAWLKAWVRGYLSDGHLAAMDRGCPLPCLAGEIARTGEEAKQAFQEIFQQRLRRVSSHIDAPETEAHRRVFAAISQMAGALMLARCLDEQTSESIRSAAADEAIATLIGRPTQDPGSSASSTQAPGADV